LNVERRLRVRRGDVGCCSELRAVPI